MDGLLLAIVLSSGNSMLSDTTNVPSCFVAGLSEIEMCYHMIDLLYFDSSLVFFDRKMLDQHVINPNSIEHPYTSKFHSDINTLKQRNCTFGIRLPTKKFLKCLTCSSLRCLHERARIYSM